MEVQLQSVLLQQDNICGITDMYYHCLLYTSISGKWDLQEAVSAQKGDHDIWGTPGGGSYE